jgi:hypothetical protein
MISLPRVLKRQALGASGRRRTLLAEQLLLPAGPQLAGEASAPTECYKAAGWPAVPQGRLQLALQDMVLGETATKKPRAEVLGAVPREPRGTCCSEPHKVPRKATPS